MHGLSNGVRELMLLIPKDDVGKSWQTRADRTKAEHFELAANIFLYAVDKQNLRYKGETYVLNPDPGGQGPADAQGGPHPVRRATGTRSRAGGGGWRPTC